MYSTTESVAAEPEVVWPLLATPAGMSRWMTGVDALRTADGQPLRAGSTLVFTARKAERTSAVIEFEETRLLALQSTQGPFTALYRYRLVPTGSGTVVSLEVSCNATGMARLVAPVIRRLMWISDKGHPKAIKALVEA